MDGQKGGKQRRSPSRTSARSTRPSFSPDGTKIAFSALSGGFSDLFVYDLDSQGAAAAHRGRLRRPAAGVVAGRTPDRVRDRPLLDEPRHAGRRQLPPGPHRRGVGAGHAAAHLREGQEHQPAVGGGRQGPLLPVRPHRHHERLPPGRRQPRPLPAHRPHHRGQRHHRPEPRPHRGRGHAAASPTACTTRTATRSTRSTTPRRLAGWRVLHGGAADGERDPGRQGRGRGGRGAARTRSRAWPTPAPSPRRPTRRSSASTTSASPTSAGGAGRYGAFFGGGISMWFSDMLGNHSLGTVLPDRASERATPTWAAS